MRILVINSGSSSIKVSMFDSGDAAGAADPKCLYEGEVSEIGEPEARFELLSADGVDLLEGHSPGDAQRKMASIADAIGMILEVVSGPRMPGVEAVGYRVVHPGAKLKEHQRITPEVLRDLEEAAAFAPLHDPAVIAMIREGMARFQQVSHYACFDTVFHGTMPEQAAIYPIPREYREQGVRRYGFHGLSCESIVRQLRREMHAGGEELPKRMVIAHLGSGCSVTAVVDGHSVDTTMGLTPTGGVVMGTRPGDLDPGLVLYLLRQQKGDREEATLAVEAMLNHAAGMVGLTGLANDMKEVREASAKGDARALLALKVFTRSVTKATGGFCWSMGGLDAIVFSGGIGEHDSSTREEVLGGLRELGVAIDSGLNSAKVGGLRRISASNSATSVFVVPAKEDLMIAVHVDMLTRLGK